MFFQDRRGRCAFHVIIRSRKCHQPYLMANSSDGQQTHWPDLVLDPHWCGHPCSEPVHLDIIFGSRTFAPKEFVSSKQWSHNEAHTNVHSDIWLLVTGTWLLIFPYILGISSSQLTFTPSFFRGVGLNHHPVMLYLFIIPSYNHI